jgi:hypothetical protein
MLQTLDQYSTCNKSEKLYPSSSLDETYSLLPFQAPLIRCASSPIWKCRVLSAHSLLPTISSSTVSDVLMKLINDVSLHNQNQLHGFLLMVQVILNTQSSDKLFDELPSGKLLGLLLGKHYIGLK